MYSTIGEQIDVFQPLNKSNPVPELYIRDTSKERREIVQEVVDFWQKKYKSHFSPTPKPNVPNINRDKFIDILDKLCDKYKIRQENIQNLYDMLDEKNDELRNNIPKGLKEKTLEKCAKSGCYLFLFKPDVLECIL
jgi:predicted HTH transcriptional regulator